MSPKQPPVQTTRVDQPARAQKELRRSEFIQQSVSEVENILGLDKNYVEARSFQARPRLANGGRKAQRQQLQENKN